MPAVFEPATRPGAQHRPRDDRTQRGRLLTRLLRIVRSAGLRVRTGSGLAAALFSRATTSSSCVLLIGGTPEQAKTAAMIYGRANLHHYEPPPANGPEELEDCLRFIESRSPFRFCFLALGSLRQEALARALQERGIARGLTLHVGTLLDFTPP